MHLVVVRRCGLRPVKNNRFSKCCRMQLRAATKQGDGDLVRFIREKKVRVRRKGRAKTQTIGTCLVFSYMYCILPCETSGTASCGPMLNQIFIYIYIINSKLYEIPSFYILPFCQLAGLFDLSCYGWPPIFDGSFS